MTVEPQNSSQNDLPDEMRVSRGLSKRVICPMCGKYGTLVARQRGKQWYYYVQHRVKEEGKWRIIEHYIGPARFYYETEKLTKKPLVQVHAYAGFDRVFISYTLLEDAEKNIDRPEILRQSMIDYCTLLTWLKELVEKEIEKTKKSFGITDDEITVRLNEIKSEFVTLIFYRKP
ncbi:hypothetical protein Igag_1965 [Ignisphaera aggregans DSM 17230]|uniref:Uncharacterized protein n=1 Tax=Ignisphaera aggregans (strain DSM 17230 / JCM 13409 / AQ1.S1) TaxID=583356 RepID=E0STH1_IGNAA|nr:hypothetical protein Igag_1965 [Ignisphaera aggregans DSM 17230]